LQLARAPTLWYVAWTCLRPRLLWHGKGNTEMLCPISMGPMAMTQTTILPYPIQVICTSEHVHMQWACIYINIYRRVLPRAIGTTHIHPQVPPAKRRHRSTFLSIVRVAPNPELNDWHDNENVPRTSLCTRRSVRNSEGEKPSACQP
jgi:hypothetical protein